MFRHDDRGKNFCSYITIILVAIVFRFTISTKLYADTTSGMK